MNTVGVGKKELGRTIWKSGDLDHPPLRGESWGSVR